MHFFDTACNQYLLPLLLLWVVVAVASLSILVESRHNLIYNLQKEQDIQFLFTMKSKIAKVAKVYNNTKILQCQQRFTSVS